MVEVAAGVDRPGIAKVPGLCQPRHSWPMSPEPRASVADGLSVVNENPVYHRNFGAPAPVVR
jgi:hypothetical protein